PGLFNLAVVKNNAGSPGAATGITQTGTYLGAVVGPLLFGVAVDAGSYSLAWLGAGVMSLAAAWAVQAGRRALLVDRVGRSSR
ncbi:MAG: MFS transporter, partial [Actinobacteria bacterium]|nr:MFS transporter [Actinomycetota bacterium]